MNYQFKVFSINSNAHHVSGMTHFDLEINFKIPKKRHSMASLINLLSNGVNGFDGFYGVKGVFDNLPKNSYV